MSTAEFPLSLFSSASSFFPGECQVSLKSPPSSPPPPFSRMRTSTHDLYHHHLLLFFCHVREKGKVCKNFSHQVLCAHCRNSSSPHSAGHNFQSTLARLWQFRQAWTSCTARTGPGAERESHNSCGMPFPKSSLDGPGGALFSLQSAHRPVLSI